MIVVRFVPVTIAQARIEVEMTEPGKDPKFPDAVFTFDVEYENLMRLHSDIDAFLTRLRTFSTGAD